MNSILIFLLIQSLAFAAIFAILQVSDHPMKLAINKSLAKPRVVISILALLVLGILAVSLMSNHNEPLKNGVYQPNSTDEIYVVVTSTENEIQLEFCSHYADGTTCEQSSYQYFNDNLYKRYDVNLPTEISYLRINSETNFEILSFTTEYQAIGTYNFEQAELPADLANYSETTN